MHVYQCGELVVFNPTPLPAGSNDRQTRLWFTGLLDFSRNIATAAMEKAGYIVRRFSDLHPHQPPFNRRCRAHLWEQYH
jgi:hypothetical protein